MSKSKRKRHSRSVDYATPQTPPAPVAPPLPPIKPRPRLLVFLLLAWVAWIIVLVLLYFKTVYPSRDTPREFYRSSSQSVS